jgi:nucleoside-diphosphate-sugar epimerase
MITKHKVVVTGGTGFVGSQLVRHLCELGFSVTIFSRGNNLNPELESLKAEIGFLTVNLAIEQQTRQALLAEAPAFIVHLSANSHPSREPDIIRQMMIDNFETTLNLYNAALGLPNLQSIITAGSTVENEQNEVPFTEDQKEKPASPYAFSKACVTLLSSYFFRRHNVPIVVVRPSIVYGEYQEKDMFIPFVIKKCLQNEPVDMTEGEQGKDFIYIKDVLDAIVLIIKKPRNVLGGIINLCTQKEITLRDVALTIKRKTNSNSALNFGALKYRDGEKMHYHGSNLKANKMLGWSPKHTFEEGIEKTIAWHKSRMQQSS